MGGLLEGLHWGQLELMEGTALGLIEGLWGLMEGD
jgi:hypothetical protein